MAVGHALKLGVAAVAAAFASLPLAAGLEAQSPSTGTSGTAQQWVVAAPGRVEPRSGEIKTGATVLGRVAEVPVRANDLVEDGAVLIRLEDDETRAKFAAAEAEAGARRRERDGQVAISGREDIRRAEDALYNADRSVMQARADLDNAVAAQRGNTGTAEAVGEARRRLVAARDRQQRERTALNAAQSRSGVPQPSRVEAALTAARADVAMADALHEKTRIRAPIAGRILQVHAKAGETVAPSPEQPLIVMGDMTKVRVKAEVDERDVSKIRVGQKLLVRSEAFPGRDFPGTVIELAPSLGSPRIGNRGPRRPTDVEVLEVSIDLEQGVPLLPGMRVDALFRPLDAPAASSATPGPAADGSAPGTTANPGSPATASSPAASGAPDVSRN